MRDRRVRVFIDQSHCKYWSQTNSFLRKARTQRPTVGKKQAIYFTLSFDKYFLQGLCISQFQLHPATPLPLAGYCGAFARPVSPGGVAFANFALPGDQTFAKPGANPELLTRTQFPTRL